MVLRNYLTFITITALPFIVFLEGCSSTPPKTKALVEVSMPADHRMHFSGKGAGAGMMLSASMGPMGVAIGVAIDEGIAKQIGETAAAGGVDIRQIVETAFDESPFNDSPDEYPRPLKIRVLYYGFKTTSADEHYSDPVVAELKLAVEGAEGERVISVYADASAEDCDVRKVELADVKVKAEAIVEAFRGVVDCGVVMVGGMVTVGE